MFFRKNSNSLNSDEYLICVDNGDVVCAIYDEETAREIYRDLERVEGVRVIFAKILKIKDG